MRLDPDTVRAYQRLFNTEDGQRVVTDLLNHFAFTKRSLFDSDTAKMAYNEGQRTVMVHIGQVLNTDPEQIEEPQDDYTSE